MVIPALQQLSGLACSLPRQHLLLLLIHHIVYDNDAKFPDMTERASSHWTCFLLVAEQRPRVLSF